MTTSTDRTRRALAIDEAAAILARTPAVLDALLRDLPDGWLSAHEGGDTWSPFDIVGHLIHADQTNWMPRARVIVEHSETRPFDDFDRFAQLRRSEGRTLDSLLGEFATVRRDCVDALARLDVTNLDRRGQHPVFGVVTLRQLLATWVAHDLDHLMQIARVMATQYADEVGPWRQYLRIIREPQGVAHA